MASLITPVINAYPSLKDYNPEARDYFEISKKESSPHKSFFPNALQKMPCPALSAKSIGRISSSISAFSMGSQMIPSLLEKINKASCELTISQENILLKLSNGNLMELLFPRLFNILYLFETVSQKLALSIPNPNALNRFGSLKLIHVTF
ncbi:MAG: hypothetical protein PHP64_02035 [Actinomycetota bacterium]|nr:hypothetical protein [Actinomycetota bacterium]